MSVLVRGMEMPNSCIDCDFCGGMIFPDGIYCCDCPPEVSHGKNISENIENNNKPDFCPLVEVPAPHGRLIDADKLMRDISEYHVSDGKFQHWVDVQPTVIEAEDGDEHDT